MKITIEISEAQEIALATLNVSKTEEIVKFLEAGAANKIKGSVVNALKSFAKSATPTYMRLPKAMQAVMPLAQFLRAGSQDLYDVLKTLGGREVKPLDELLADILNDDRDSE